MRVVVALGGNAILRRDERGTAAEQRAAIREACDGLAAMAATGNDLIVVHGNGPQVGALMLQHASAEAVVPAMPLDVLVAQTQGSLGYLIQQELGAALKRRGITSAVIALVTEVLVDPADPAFLRPTKPIGPHLSAAAAGELRRSGVPVTEVPGGAWRRIVPSPKPLALVEEAALRALIDGGMVPVVAGGGGIPVVREGNGYRGIEGVIDKDHAAALVAEIAGADALVILTDVDRVLVDRGKRTERAADKLTIDEAEDLLARGEFPPGSMGPKMEAAVSAARAGRRAIIGALANAAAILDGSGTEVVP